MLSRWKDWARSIKRETLVMLVAMRDPRTPWYVKAAAGCVVAYALSPIDLIPDPIPILGLLDDLVLIPIGVWFVRRIMPADVLTDARSKVDAGEATPSRIGLIGATIIAVLWVATVVAMGWFVYARWR